MATTTGPTGSHTPASTDSPDFTKYAIKNTNIPTAPGVTLSSSQQVLVGSVLDLFEGYPSLKKFSLWSQTATFADPITTATGYAKYTAQFYGLPALFKPIQLLSYKVLSSSNPIELEMSNKYTVKGIKMEKTMESIVKIFVGQDGKIEKVEDRWNGNMPEGAISEAFRKLNAVTVPNLIKVPKTEEEDSKMALEREGKSS